VGKKAIRLYTVRSLMIKQHMTTIVSSFGVAAVVEDAEEEEAVVMDVSINGIHQRNKRIISR